ncbi:E3 ubiquitin-protein ligase TRAIP [Stomoxys calcitrans]|uniref:E3 ubiquitin-protein ligase TRAIP n=1 Tax=Stomoxys calcitrans TaxID=35570 RepID=UPI0027E29BE9|nr:E3 ubiquitin-protein ligase TRAIP [Stomoxys calcitrans]
MSGLKLMCPICTDDVRETEEVDSTNCGHIFHSSCLEQWKERNSTCPQCRHKNPSTHKLFFIINDSDDETQVENSDLTAKLESSLKKIQNLKEKLEESNVNFLSLEELYTVQEEQTKEMKNQMAELANNFENFLQLHALYCESEERARLLLQENERLTLENDYVNDQLDLKTPKIHTTSASPQYTASVENSIDDAPTAKSELEDRIKHLQQDNALLNKENSFKTKEVELKTKELSMLRRMLKETSILLDAYKEPQHTHET